MEHKKQFYHISRGGQHVASNLTKRDIQNVLVAKNWTHALELAIQYGYTFKPYEEDTNEYHTL